ncbi:uncharacterized protein LOC133527124 [Cydia pomonella]|uniref:uncharacterized protein LOC133527124 n=1 Tax=Cydia pomonella TaxID=82600 RepID=UPI002ADE7FDD|nr:uncharacterized protein LOC133527124 [Cydia pomonella]
MTKGKSPGRDGLCIEHLRHAGPHLPRVLSLLFNLCLSHSYLPPELLETLVVPIIKNRTGDASDGSNYRPISLATVVAKVFDSVINSYLRTYVKLHDNQFGFRPGLSTETAILSLKHTVKYYTDRKTPIYACFLDLSKAFDLVSYDILWKKLQKSRLPSEFIHLLRYWYLNQENRVRWAGEVTETYRLECGVRQGGLSSPILFNLYVDALIEQLSSTHIGCHVDGVCLNNISYADDMVLLAPSVGALRKLVAICESYASSHGSLWVSYTQKSYNALRVVYNNAFRVLVGLPRFCSASAMFAEARTDGFAAIIRKKAASLLRRTRDSTNSILKMIADHSERVVTAHVDVEDDDAADDDSDADDEQVPSTSSVTAPAACNVSEAAPLLDDSEHDILTHATSSSPKVPSARPLLKIVAVTVSGPTGSVDTFALLDDGSSGTYIDSEISSRIGAKASDRLIHLDCVVGLSKDIKVQYVNFNIQGRHSTEVHSIKKARSINGLGAARQCAYQDSVRKYPYLADIAGEFCYGDVKPMLIIGLDNWHLSLATDVRKGTKTQPAAILTALGWVLFGFGCSKTKRVDVVNHITLSEPDSDSDCFTLERLIREQFKIDSIGISKKEARNADDERAIQVLESTAHRLPGGRFEVGLLWKADNLDIPNSYKLALSRFLSLENKMIKDPCYAERYRRNIHDMLSKEYAEQCSSGPASGRPVWYLPHFGVINPNKPNKLRTVHDAAAKSHGVSLNSLLLTGPDLLQPLLGILMRFREGAVALNADIREMFPQIKIIEKDRDAQRFLWRDTPGEPIRTFRMSSMIFGAASSPFTAIHIKNKNALEWQETYPEAARVIIDDHYMDDCITSLDDIDKAAKLAADIYTVHAHAGFEMRSWTSNSPSALSLLPKESLLEVPRANNIDVELGRLATPVRTLGLIWQPANDLIGFNTGVKKETVLPEKLTKRGVLVHVMRIYDPLGILAPIVVRGRIMFQDAWRKGLNWDQELSQCDSVAWKSWFQDLISTSSLRIPRRYNLSDLEVAGCELHVFSDASESAFAAVAYWRFLYVNGDVRLSLICSKVRVSPIRPVSIPRLELQGALIAARLAMSICEAHRLKPMRRVFWCDSMTALGWLRSDARTLKTFVSHRVGEILELTNISEWHWVPSDLNVADDATRVKRFVLSPESRWISGPSFLLSSDWPAEPQIDVSGLGREEYKNIIHLITETDLPVLVSADPSRFSSWLRMVRATAKAHLFLSLLRMRSMRRRDVNFNLPRHEGLLCTFRPTCTSSPGTSNSPNIPLKITASDISLAESHILRQSQLDSFKEDILRIKNRDPLPRSSRLFKLSPFLDDNDQLRMFSRIAAAAGVTDEVKRPLILDGKHPAVRLLIARYHQKAGHANKEKVLNELHQRFWILGLRNAARSVAHDCQFCKLRRARTFTPPMGNLPECRLAHHQRPFSFVGLDYFGPVLVSVGRRREKRYVALFTCLVIRAVHLEVVHSLTTDAAIMCLRRFIARRGTPQEIWSDHGTAFVGANRELRALYGDSVEDFAANESINWRFIPPAAPFMGGAWERLVRSVKEALKVTLREQAPSDEVLSTLLAEAEALVNTRPLTHVSLDSDADEALTPAHFILTSPSGRPIPATLTEADLLSRNKWRRAVRLADHFWQRWVKEYLPCLSPRTGGGSPPNIAVGDVVIVCDSNLPRGSWPKGRITALYPGRDGIIARRKWTWIGHTLRRDSNHIPRQALEWTPQGKRGSGRPKESWRRSVASELTAIGLSWPETKHAAQDGGAQDALCST